MPAPPNPYEEWNIYKIGEGRAGLSLSDVDRDGRMDVLVNNTWFENPDDPASRDWPMHVIPNADSDVKNAAAVPPQGELEHIMLE